MKLHGSSSLLVELLVVALGVLLALWADQWWVDIQEQREEQKYLLALYEDVSQAIEAIDTTSAEAGEWLQAATDLSAAQGRAEQVGAQEVIRLLGIALFNIEVYEIPLGAYEDLLVTGRVGLISDPEVRLGLSRLEQKISELRTAETDLTETQHGIIDPFLVGHTNLSALARVGYSAADSRSAQQSGGPLAPALITNRFDVDHRALLDNLELQSIVALRIVLLSELIVAATEVRQALVELQDDLPGTD